MSKKKDRCSHLAMAGEPHGFSRVTAGFSSYDGEFRLPLVISESFKVLAESHAVLLDLLVTHLRNEFVENGILLSKVDDFHILKVLKFLQIIQIYPFLLPTPNFP